MIIRGGVFITASRLEDLQIHTSAPASGSIRAPWHGCCIVHAALPTPTMSVGSVEFLLRTAESNEDVRVMTLVSSPSQIMCAETTLPLQDKTAKEKGGGRRECGWNERYCVVRGNGGYEGCGMDPL